MQQAEISLLCDAVQSVKTELLANFDKKNDTLQAGLNNIQGALSTLNDHVTELEHRVGSTEDNIVELMKHVETLEKENVYLKEKVDDAENRSRSSNLRFINIPERREGKDMITVINNLIPLLFGKDNFPTAPVIERAHRSPTFTTSNRSTSRPILVKFLHFQDKLRILHLAREKGDLTYMGDRVHVFPDFSAALIHKQHQFDSVKKKLLAADFKYSLLYPCTLRVMVDGKPKLFWSPGEAETLLHDLSLSSSPG